MTIQMKAIKQYFVVLLFILLDKVVLHVISWSFYEIVKGVTIPTITTGQVMI